MNRQLSRLAYEILCRVQLQPDCKIRGVWPTPSVIGEWITVEATDANNCRFQILGLIIPSNRTWLPLTGLCMFYSIDFRWEWAIDAGLKQNTRVPFGAHYVISRFDPPQVGSLN